MDGYAASRRRITQGWVIRASAKCSGASTTCSTYIMRARTCSCVRSWRNGRGMYRRQYSTVVTGREVPETP